MDRSYRRKHVHLVVAGIGVAWTSALALCLAMPALAAGTPGAAAKAVASPEVVVPYRPLEFDNPATITINDDGVATPYPSTINVTGTFGYVWDVRVRLHGLSHSFPDDIDILLVDPAGHSLVLMSDSGGGTDVNNLELTFDDHAPTGLPDGPGTLVSKSYRPRNYSSFSDVFPAPAPAGYGQPGPSGNATLASTFGRSSPTGTWSLYVLDDAFGGAGQITGGWSLIFTQGYKYAGGAITITDNTVATPYPSTISVAGLPPHLADVKLEIDNFSHSFPNDVDMLLVAPGGQKFIPMSDVGGGNPGESSVTFVLEDQGLASLTSGSNFSAGAFRPSNAGGGDVFPGPAPAGPYRSGDSDSFHNVFDGVDPNGTWSLYVLDDTFLDSGSIGSWALILTPYSEFNNGLVITLNDGATATPYPSNIPVGDSGDVAGTLNGAYVRINQLTHTFPDDLDMLLADPFNRGLIIQSDAGGGDDVSSVSYRIDDRGIDLLPDSGTIVDGSTYYPTNWTGNDGADAVFAAPAPQSGIVSPLSDLGIGFRTTFQGGNPNGVWKLFIRDDQLGDSGTINLGWTLGILTAFDPILIDSFDDSPND